MLIRGTMRFTRRGGETDNDRSLAAELAAIAECT